MIAFYTLSIHSAISTHFCFHIMSFSTIKNHPWSKKVIALFRQGLAPRELALSIIIGSVIGIMPVFGVAAFLIGFISIVLRLNLPIALFVTYAITPVHLLLFIPFMRIGESILRVQHSFLSFADIRQAFEAGYLIAFQQLSFQLFCGVVGWFLVAIPIAILSYLILWKILAFYNKKTVH